MPSPRYSKPRTYTFDRYWDYDDLGGSQELRVSVYGTPLDAADQSYISEMDGTVYHDGMGHYYMMDTRLPSGRYLENIGFHNGGYWTAEVHWGPVDSKPKAKPRQKAKSAPKPKSKANQPPIYSKEIAYNVQRSILHSFGGTEEENREAFVEGIDRILPVVPGFEQAVRYYTDQVLAGRSPYTYLMAMGIDRDLDLQEAYEMVYHVLARDGKRLYDELKAAGYGTGSRSVRSGRPGQSRQGSARRGRR